MTDSDLRELERRFRSTGSTQDEAAWLRARHHAGEVTEDELRLRAYDGDEAAREAMGAWENDGLWSKALLVRERVERAARLATAKEEAVARGKQPFDISALAAIYEFASPEVAENYRRYSDEFEEQYYVTWPQIMSLAEFAAHRRRLDVWG